MTRYTTDWYATDRRIDTITAHLKHPKRVLDFGAFSTATAHTLIGRYPGVSVVVVDDTIATESSAGIQVVKQRMTPAGITKLGRFDATLALSVLHHVTNWRQYLTALQNSAPVLFVETAHPDEVLPKAIGHTHSAAVIEHLKTIGTPIGETPGYDPRFHRTLWVIRQP